MQRCDPCGYDYDAATPTNASGLLRTEVTRLADLLATADPELAQRGTETTWSAVQYAGHVRDVLLVQRERALAARLQSNPVAVSMGRDERVAWGEYDLADLRDVGRDVLRAAEWLARTLDNLGESDWSRTLLYNYPEPTERSLRWLAAHTIHEVVHHRADIERLLAG